MSSLIFKEGYICQRDVPRGLFLQLDIERQVPPGPEALEDGLYLGGRGFHRRVTQVDICKEGGTRLTAGQAGVVTH